MTLFKKYLLFSFIFAFINAVLLLIFFVPRFDHSDTPQYVATINYLSGNPGGEMVLNRIIKPLPLLIGALLNPIMSPEDSLIFQNIIFYFLSVFLLFLIIYYLYNNEKQAFYGAILFSTAYPVLAYGLGPITDSAGVFFWLLSILIALNFLKNPKLKTAFFGGFMAGLGMLFKENLAVAPIFFTALALIAVKNSFIEKLKPIIVFGLAFLIFPIIINLTINNLYSYSYLDLYVRAWDQPGESRVGKYLASPLRTLIETGRALFWGWLFVLMGILKEWAVKNKERAKILLALIFPSLSFFLWSYPHNRIIFIAAGPLLILLASFGLVRSRKLAENSVFISPLARKGLVIEAFLLSLYVLTNYFFLDFFLKYGHTLADKF